MASPDLEDIARDLHEVKRDLAFIKYVLSQEGDLSDEAKERLSKARGTPDSEYVELE